MADKTITDLDFAPGSVNDINTFFAVMQGGAAYKLTGAAFYNAMAAMYNAHGAIRSIEKTGTSGQLIDVYTITFGDNTTTTFTVTNGNGVTAITQYFARSTSGSTVPVSGWSTSRQTLTATYKYLWSYFVFTTNNGTLETPKAVIGAYGDQGLQTYVHIRYASSCSGNPPLPASDSDMGTDADNWMGIYSGTSATAPTTRASYTWSEIKGETGDPAQLVDGRTSVSYASSTSGTITPSAWQDSPPQVLPGNYLWTRTTLGFNSGSPVVYYTVTRFGVDGAGSAGTATPLMDSGEGNVGSSTSFAREDHVHPTDTSILPLWRGKKALIIGDSWAEGYNGSTDVTPWHSYFLSMTGLTADILSLSGAGFVKTSHTGDYTGYNFVSVLDSIQNNSYDIIIFQGGSNDVVTSTVTASNIASAFASLRSKCDTYFHGVPIYYYPTMPFYFLLNDFTTGTEETNGKNNKAVALVHGAIEQGIITCKQSTLFGFYNEAYKGTDSLHPSATGHEFFGKYAASFLISGYFPNDQYKMIGGNGATWYAPDITVKNITDNYGITTKYFDGKFGVSFDFVLNVDTYNAIVEVGTGFPLCAMNYTSGIASFTSNNMPYCVPAFARQDAISVDLRRVKSSLKGTAFNLLVEYDVSSL